MCIYIFAVTAFVASDFLLIIYYLLMLSGLFWSKHKIKRKIINKKQQQNEKGKIEMQFNFYFCLSEVINNKKLSFISKYLFFVIYSFFTTNLTFLLLSTYFYCCSHAHTHNLFCFRTMQPFVLFCFVLRKIFLSNS